MAAGRDAPNTELRRDVACPFCSLVCDDLEIEVAGEALTVRRGACPISRAQFERALPTEGVAQAAGAPCDRGEAIAQAARILRQSRLPVIGGLATDIEGMRGALALADRLGGVVDHRGSRGLFSDLTPLRDIGTMTTTLSEVRNRADLLLIVGPDPLPLLPRFLERCFSDRPTLFAEGGLERRLIRLGPPADVPPALPKGVRYSHIPCALDELAPAVGRFRAILKGRSPGAGDDAALVELAGAFRNASYGVVSWMAGLLPPDAADLIALTLVETVRELNVSRRAACLPLAGAENLTGANQACLWQTGYPLRTGFGTGSPRHDPLLYSAERLVESGEADALVWVSTFGGGPPPILPPELPLILLAPPGSEMPAAPAVFLPVGRPGIDHAGQIFRSDGVVALPLRALRASGLPSAGETLGAIAQALEGA